MPAYIEMVPGSLLAQYYAAANHTNAAYSHELTNKESEVYDLLVRLEAKPFYIYTWSCLNGRI